MIKYGSIVRIHGQDQGLIVAKSFTDLNVYYMKYNNLKYLSNYRESLFQILPRGSFEIHDEFLKSKQISIQISEYEKINLQLRLKTEMDQYKIVIQNKMNEEVLFGAEIVLKHVDSEYYLSGTYNCSEFCTDAFKLQMSQYLSTHAIFKILPSYSYQQEGQPVNLDEPVMLEHDKTGCRIDYVNGHKVFVDQEFECQVHYKYRPFVKRTFGRYESVITHNSNANWQIQLHEDYQSNQERIRIKPFDLCVFRNTENNSYLSVSENKLVMKNLKNANMFDYPLDAVFEVEPVQKNGQRLSQPKTKSDTYQIRHYLSGRMINSLGGLSIEQGNTVLTIKQVTHKDVLNNNSFIKIMSSNLELQMINKVITKEQEENQELFFKSLDTKDLEYVEYDVAFRSESKHAFQIRKISREAKEDLLTILSGQELLLQFSDILKLQPEVVEKQINPQILKLVVSQLQKLLNYLVNDINGELSENQPSLKRQRNMKDLQFVEILLEIIFYMSYKNGLERLFIQWKSDRERTKHIFKLSYKLIEKLVKNNSITKLHVSQWLELFLHSAMMIDDASVQNCLRELLDNNYAAISKFISKQSIKRLVDILRLQYPHEKYLKILSSICICNGKSIISNQIHALTLFFNQMPKEYKIEIKKETNGVQIYCSLNKNLLEWRSLKELYLESQEKDELQTWNYFLSYMNLLGDVSINRNKFAKKYVEDNFSLDTLCSILEDPVATELNAIEPILKVIHGAYLDCQHYTPIRRLARVREWETIEKKNDILRTHAEEKLKPENCDVKRVMRFIETFIGEFNSFSCKNKNSNFYCILSCFKTTLRLGFWPSIQNLIDLFPHLLRILNTEDRKFPIQEIQCKTLICEIIDIIIDMETNVRVSKTTQSLKKMLAQKQEIKNSCETPKQQESNNSGKKQPTMTLTYLLDKAKNKTHFLPSPKNQEKKEINIFKDMAKVLKKEINEKDQIYDVDEWMALDKQLIQSRSIFVKVKDDIELILQRLAYYEDPELLQYSLSILNRIYGQRTELRKNFEKVIIVATGITWTLSVESRVTRTKLWAVVDRNILQCTLENQKDFNIYLWRESENPKESGIIQDIHYLVETMKQDKDCYRNVCKKCAYDSLNPENALDALYNESEQPHKLHQSLLKSQDLHDSIISFLEISQTEQNPLVMKFLHSCYKFLTMLIWNHLENKNDFCRYRHLMYNHIQFNIGCIDFFKELFQNNKTLLFSEKDLRQITSIVIEHANKISTTYYYKSKLLDFLRILLIYNNKIIKFNQVLVMSKLQEKQNTNIMYFLNNNIHYETNLFNLTDIILQIKQYENQDGPIIKISAELTYLFTYFEIFSLLVEDRNTINPGKCKQMHTYPQLLQLLTESHSFWPLKRYVRAYINRLYYDSDDFENISQLIIETDLNNIITDLDLIIQEKKQSSIKIIQNPVRYNYMNSYVYLCLEETLITLNTILSKEQFLFDLEDILYQNFNNHQYLVHLQLFELGNKLAQIKRSYNSSRQIEVFSRILINIFKSVFATFDINLLLIREGLLNQAMQMKCITEQVRITRRKMSGSRITEEPTTTFETSANPTKLFEIEQSEQSVMNQLISNIFENQDQTEGIAQRKVQSIKNMFIKQNEEDINEQLNQKHRRLVNILSVSRRFQRFLEEEFIQVCEKLRNQPINKLEDFVRNAIKLNMQNQIKDHLKIFLLKLLTRMITEKNNNNKDIYLSIDQWQPEFWSNCKGEIEQTQDFLESCGAAEFICALLQEQNLELRMQLASELLTFIIAFLLGGNTKCQNSILQKMKQDPTNLMLNNFASLIKKIGRAVYNNYKIRKTRMQEFKFNVLMVDNYDYFDQDTNTMKRCNVIEHDEAKENTFKKQAIEILCRSFRVLQLLSENNNVSMKNFMRQQIDIDDNQKINSINFIELTTTQLRMFLKIVSKPILMIPTAMIEFLVEIIQLPCLENQIMLCKTTFYEDTCYMSRYFQDSGHQQCRLFEKQDDLWDLYELQNKILISVMSVLEGNDDKIYDDLQNKLEPRFLIDFVNQNLSILQVKGKDDFQQLLQLQEQMFTSEIQRILNVVIIKQKIKDKVQGSNWVMEFEQLQSEQLKSIFTVLESKIRNIEIIYAGKQQKIFFPSHPLFEFLSDQTKDQLMFNVSRDTQREKILGLIEAKQQIFNEIEYNYELNQLAIPVTHKSITTFRTIASTISVFINIFMIFAYEILISNKQANFIAEFHEQLLLRIMALFQLITSFCYVFLYYISRIPLILKQMPQQQQNIFTQIYYILTNEDELLQLFIYVIISIMGQWKHYYFSLHLFDLFSRLSLLQNVFQAISYNAKQLFVVALLGVMFVYVFSITGLNQYVDDIYPVDEPQDSCNTMISCMITLITSGVIGTSMSKWDPIKFVLDTVYFVFFALLFTNIVSGIMIDTFAELRDKRQKIEDDKKNLCFICGVDRQTLEKNLEEFDQHLEKKHFLWNYIFYMYILIKKDSTEYTGLEYWISDKIMHEDINWFPMINLDPNQMLQKYETLQSQINELQRQMERRTEEIIQTLEQNIIKL